MFRCCIYQDIDNDKPLIDKDVYKRILLVGECYIGKTTWIKNKSFSEGYSMKESKPTIGIEYYTLYFDPENKKFYPFSHLPDNITNVYKIGICDSSGNDRFTSIIQSYISKVDEVWLCLNNIMNTLSQIQNWALKLQCPIQKIKPFLLPEGIFIPLPSELSFFVRP